MPQLPVTSKCVRVEERTSRIEGGTSQNGGRNLANRRIEDGTWLNRGRNLATNRGRPREWRVEECIIKRIVMNLTNRRVECGFSRIDEWRTEPRESTTREWNLANGGRNLATIRGPNLAEWSTESCASTNRGQNLANRGRSLATNRGRNLAMNRGRNLAERRIESGTSRIEG